ncbi:MAG: hypothetical protein ACRYGL_03765 [Janthinobacterium lividum]
MIHRKNRLLPRFFQRAVVVTICREQLRTVDLTDIETGEIIQPLHPRHILRTQFLTPYNMSVNVLAMALHVPLPRTGTIGRGRRCRCLAVPCRAVPWRLLSEIR